MTYFASVIIPTYNQDKYILSTIKSVLRYTDEENCEIIVINDGSTDSTNEVLSSIDIKNVKIVTTDNRGVSASLNKGIKISTGEYLFFLGGDDQFIPERYELQLESMKKYGADLCFGLPCIIDEDSNLLDCEYRKEFFTALYTNQDLTLSYRLFYGGNFICAPTACINRRLFNKIGYFSTGLLHYQDYEFWIRACGVGAKFIFSDKRLINYRIRRNNANLSGSINNSRADSEYLWVIKNFFRFFKEDILYQDFQYSLNSNIICNTDSPFYKELVSASIYIQHGLEEVRQIGKERLLSILDKEGLISLSNNLTWSYIHRILSSP